MADGEKRMHFANFNITFGKDEDPMLTHFEDIIFPAFCSGTYRFPPFIIHCPIRPAQTRCACQ